MQVLEYCWSQHATEVANVLHIDYHGICLLGLPCCRPTLPHSNAFYVATAAVSTGQVWDLRKRKCIYTIPAHTSLVSTVRYQPHNGHTLLSCGYDCQARIWSTRDWKCLKVLSGHEGKIMAVDMCPTWTGVGSHGVQGVGYGAGFEALVGSVSYDRTLKLWAPENVADIAGSDNGEDHEMSE